MSKYELPSGTASIDAVVGFNTEKDYTTPMSKRDISTALRESLYCNLEQQERIAELESELKRQRSGLVNLIDLDIIPTRYVDGTMNEIMAIDNLLGGKNEAT